MRRADRPLQIIQILRRSARPITAAVLAEELEVTVHTDVGSGTLDREGLAQRRLACVG